MFSSSSKKAGSSKKVPLRNASTMGERFAAQCFVPELLIKHLSLEKVKLLTPTSFLLEGACLLVDLSGWFLEIGFELLRERPGGHTRVAAGDERLHGEAGGHQYAHGGDIVNWSGDHIVCVFSEDEIYYESKYPPQRKGSLTPPRTAVTPGGDEKGSIRLSIAQLAASANAASAAITFAKERPDSDSDFGLGVGVISGKDTGAVVQGAPSITTLEGGLDHGLGSSSSLHRVPRQVSLESLVTEGQECERVENVRAMEALADEAESEKEPDSPSPSSRMTELQLVDSTLVHRAITCALRLREVPTSVLTLRVGVSCGEICFGLLGGYNDRWECLISGPCVQQLSHCLAEVPSTGAGLVASKGCYESLGKKSTSGFGSDDEDDVPLLVTTLDLQELPSSNHLVLGEHIKTAASDSNVDEAVQQWTQLHRSDTVPALISRFVPVPVQSGLGNAGLKYLGEMREVTTVLVRWEGYDSKKHKDLLSLNATFTAAQRILHRHGAFLRQFVVSGEGCVLLAMWGVPSLSYYDNSFRALSCAAELHVKLAELGMQTSMGISTGEAYCGTVGSGLRMEYTCIGDAVSLAAALMSTAQMRILVDEATHTRLPLASREQLVKQTIVLEGTPVVYGYLGSEIGGVEFGHLLEQMCSTSSTFQPFRSRHDAVRDWVTMMAPTQREGANKHVLDNIAYVVVEGGRDSGKTAVAKWLRRLAVSKKLPACVVELQQSDQRVEYSMWRMVFRRLMPRELFSSSDKQRRYIRTLLMELYPANEGEPEERAITVMQLALGVTCSVEELRRARTFDDRDHPLAQTSNIASPRDVASPRVVSPLSAVSLRPALSGKDFARRKSLRPSVMEEILLHIFSHLLRYKVVLVVVENIHFADTRSLSVLLHLQRLQTRSAVVLTTQNRSAHSATQERGSLKLASFKSKAKSSAKTSNPWNDRYRDMIESNTHAKVITLDRLSLQEVESMFCAAMNLPSVSSKVASLVHDLSGGALFWVREILTFLRDHGTDEFLQIVAETQGFDDSTPAAQTSNISSKGTLLSSVSSLLGFGTSGSGKGDSSKRPSGLNWRAMSITSRLGKSFDDHATVPLKEGIPDLLATTGKSLSTLTYDMFINPDNMRRTKKIKSKMSSIEDIEEEDAFARAISGKNGVSPMSSKASNSLMSSKASNNSSFFSSSKYSNKAGSSKGAESLLSSRISKIKSSQSNKVKSGKSGKSGRFSSNWTGSSKTGSSPDNPKMPQLELLVVCRFEKLSLEVQRILRTASILGAAFSRELLFGLLPPSLQQEMSPSLQLLVTLNWLSQDSEEDSRYLFAHPAIHKIIYELNPPNERKLLHLQTAQYLQATGGDDPSQYPLLSRHFLHCDKEQALRYVAEAFVLALQDPRSLDALGLQLPLLSSDCCASVQDRQFMRMLADRALRRYKLYHGRQLSNFPPKSANFRRQPVKPAALCCGARGAVIEPYSKEEEDESPFYFDRDLHFCWIADELRRIVADIDSEVAIVEVTTIVGAWSEWQREVETRIDSYLVSEYSEMLSDGSIVQQF
eukprot:CAMPEP_0173323532 /NCGR_PEP_ID=MMETSP1143-20121109/30569_1 /TAXON_ID=483371 /ORGANISM="non described non described, Strain CCMP2298" /LENGTH=1534 /DNA_ID=CAMNT_0014267507 /DNA_START=69 /DNA_END=4674 /DNA_ORIENTATION=+